MILQSQVDTSQPASVHTREYTSCTFPPLTLHSLLPCASVSTHSAPSSINNGAFTFLLFIDTDLGLETLLWPLDATTLVLNMDTSLCLETHGSRSFSMLLMEPHHWVQVDSNRTMVRRGGCWPFLARFTISHLHIFTLSFHICIYIDQRKSIFWLFHIYI
jgi:hypothetical protein